MCVRIIYMFVNFITVGRRTIMYNYIMYNMYVVRNNILNKSKPFQNNFTVL